MVWLLFVIPFLFIAGTFIYILGVHWEWAEQCPLAVGLLTACILIAALFPALWTFYTARRVRMAEIAMRILEHWNSEAMLEARRICYEIIYIEKQDFHQRLKHYIEHDPSQFYKLRPIPALLEFTGWLARRSAIEKNWLFDLLPIEELYTDWKEYIKESQREQGIIKNGDEASCDAYAYFGNFVWLNNEEARLRSKK